MGGFREEVAINPISWHRDQLAGLSPAIFAIGILVFHLSLFWIKPFHYTQYQGPINAQSLYGLQMMYSCIPVLRIG